MQPILSNGGYPYNTDNGEGGIPILKPYLEGPFYNGLKAALGHDYFYEVMREIVGGSNTYGWYKVPFYAKIFIDTEKEVFGSNALEPGKLTNAERNLTQTELYKKGKDLRTKMGTTKGFWTATKYFNTSFVIVNMAGNAQDCFSDFDTPAVGIIPAFCIF
jgi:hypothetical protein